MADRDVDPVVRQCAGGAFRPLDQRQGGLRQWRQTDLLQFGGIVDAVKVGMKQRKWRQVVALRQREGRAWNLEFIVAGEIADHRPRRRGLAGAEVAGKRNEIAGADQQGKIGH